MPVGKVINVPVTYNLVSQEGIVKINASTELRIIESEFQMKVWGLKSYQFNESVRINITGSFDPEDPGTNLVYNWVCPTWVVQKTLCPSNLNPLILTLT